MNDRIKQDINRLVEQPRQPRTLPPVEPVGGIPAERGVAVYQASGSGGGGGGGIASPLTEPSALARDYWWAGIRSTDGLFVYPAIKQLNMRDADNNEVIINLADPNEAP